MFSNHTRLRPLDLAGRVGRSAAIAANSSFIKEMRDEMRKALAEAWVKGELPVEGSAVVM